MKAKKLTVIAVCAAALTMNANGEEFSLVSPSHVYKRGTQIYSIGHGSGGAQYGLFYGCKGVGRSMNLKDFPGQYSYEKCVKYEFHGDAGAWVNSPDGRFFYIQDTEYMGHRIFQLIDIENQALVPNLRVPSVPKRDGAAFGPNPSNGEAGFSNNGDTFLAVVPLSSRTELLIYDKPTATAWALRKSLPMEASVSGVYPLDTARTLLWTRTGNLRLFDIKNSKSTWTVNVPILADDKESTRAKVIVVSPNLEFVLLVSELGAALLAVNSGVVVSKHIANRQQIPSTTCSMRSPDAVVNSLPRSPGRCGQLHVRDDGSAFLMMQSGATLTLKRR